MKGDIKLIAPIFDNLIRRFRCRAFDIGKYDIKVIQRINKLYERLDLIKSCGDDEKKILYFSISRGEFQDYWDYLGVEEDDDYAYEDYKREWNETYKRDVCWYRLVATKYEDFRVVSINREVVVQANISDEISNFECVDLHVFLDLIIVKVDECISMLEKDIYNDFVDSNISLLKRVGMIKRSDYWDCYPEYRINFWGNFTKDEIEYFINDISKDNDDIIKEMTANKYYECCYLCYKEALTEEALDKIRGLLPKEVYLKYADGRDEGLRDINPNSSKEFDNWYNDKSRFGGHPWEIIRGHSFNRINLCVGYDGEGYYLSLDGSVADRTELVLKMYLSLRKNNIPVKLYYKDELRKYVLEEDYIGIVPEGVMPIKCDSYFPKEKLISYINLSDEDEMIIDKVKWQEIDKAYLK